MKKKKRSRTYRLRRPQVQKKTSPGETTAIVRVAAPTERPWELSTDQVVLLKNYLKIADASNEELAGCLEVARRYRLDPFKQGQIWFVKRWDKNAVSMAGAKGAYIYTPQVGIYGMLHIAARDHSDYGSVSEAEFGPMFMHEVENHKFKAPEWCRVKAFKKNITEPTVATIYFEEFCPALWDNARLFWAKMPRAQIEKCAKARVVRTAYPDLGGLYIPEEMERINADVAQDYTPGGRLITVNGVTPSGQVVDRHGSHQAAQRVLQDKLASHGGKPAEPEVMPPGAPASRQSGPKRQVSLDWSNPQDPLLMGDTEDLVPRSTVPYGLLKGLNVTWSEKDSFWHVGLNAVKDLRAVCLESGYELTEIHPPPPKPAPKASGAKPKQEPAAPTLVNGTIHRTIMGTTQRNQPVLSVKLNNEWLKCYVNTIFDFLSKGVAQAAELWIDKNHTIVGLKRIGKQAFDDDGRTPVMQRRDQEPTKTLFP